MTLRKGLVDMLKITANTSKVYDILIGSNLIKDCGKYISKVVNPCKAMIVTDSNVGPLYANAIKTALDSAGFDSYIHTFKAGEKNKNIETVYNITLSLAEKGFNRKDIVVALGGGVCGDMAGFASSIYMRGIRFIQVSTSILSDIDSSVGGKTGCDLPVGKNLIGAFHQPELVVIDTNVLSTLPKRFYNDGMGEAIKYGVIASSDLMDKICDDIDIEQLIFECVDIKRKVVENDEKEQGERKLLNFGHTLGHAIEKYYNFDKYTHGEAVAIGMCMISDAACANGYCDKTVGDKIRIACKRFSLPTECDAPIEELSKIALSDKKSTSNGIDFVLPRTVGKCEIVNIKKEDILPFLKKGIK